MNCLFNLCEFYNLAIGSILGSLVGLILVIFYEKLVHRRKLKALQKIFLPLESTNEKTFDWICYDIVGRERSNPNGSYANIKYLDGYLFEIKVKEASGSIWIGNITMTDSARGSLTFNYPGKYEYGFKDCYLGQEAEGNDKFDYWILVGDGKSYFNELIRRERKYS